MNSAAITPPDNPLTPQVDSTTSIVVTTLHDGTKAPAGETVQVLDLGGVTGGTYALHFVITNAQGVVEDIHTGQIEVGASAAAVLAALDAVLNPNNANPALPYTDNVAVEQHGSTFTLVFRGAFAGYHWS